LINTLGELAMVELQQQALIRCLKNLYRKIRGAYWTCLAKKKPPLPDKKAGGTPVLFFLPDAGIGLYIKSLAVIAAQLKMRGYQVFFVRCFNIFERCTFMDSESLPLDATEKEKKLLCTYCYRSFDKNIVKNDFEFIDFRHFVFESDAKEIKNRIQENLNGPFPFTYEGINFSDILQYNFSLYLKKTNLLNLSDSELKLWQQYLTSLFVAYKAVKRLIEKFDISHIIMSEEYSLNLVVRSLANQIGRSLVNISFPFHKDIDISQIRIMQDDSFTESFRVTERWLDFKYLSLSSSQLRDVVDDLVIRMSKKGIYSYSPMKTEGRDLYRKLGLNKSKKTIIAYPSSPDEVKAALDSGSQWGVSLVAREDAFVEQFEWLDDLIAFTEKSEVFQLVIRMHPRMAPNHREKLACAELNAFLNRYVGNYENVKIIFPEDPISSFDLAEIADVVTVSWSSMGVFMARLGIPVVSGLKLFVSVPNDSFHVFCETKAKYFQTITLLSERPPDLEGLRHAYRWYNMTTLGQAIDLGDIIQDDQRKLDVLSKNADQLERALIDRENVLEMNLKALRDVQSEKMAHLENHELRKQLFRLLHFFMTNKDDFFTDAMMNIDFACRSGENNKNYTGSLLKIEGNQVEYFYQGEKIEKYSPMVARMAMLAQKLTAGVVTQEPLEV
jgi:hypothetical protein